MALNIPNVDSPGTGFLKGVNTGGTLFSRIMQPILEREKQKQQAAQFAQQQKQLEAHFQANYGLSKAAAQRAAQAATDAHQIAMNKLDPTYEAKQYAALEDYWRNRGNPTTRQNDQAQSGMMPTQEAGQGMGLFTPEGLAQNQQVQQQEQRNQEAFNNPYGVDLDLMKQHPMLRGWYKKNYGIDPLVAVPETPEQKRALDLQSKIDLENIKTGNKTKALEQAELVAIKKDLPTIEKSLKGVNELLNIAKSSPDMFGHGFMPDRFAKTTKNKNFGKWQNLISDAIAGLEQKLSARGNIVALKMAAQLKPSHAEQQDVAIGKLESMRQQLVDSINNSRGKLGQEKVPDQSSNMDLSQMSDEELQRIASGGK